MNPFVYPSPLTKRFLQNITETARATYERGWNDGTAGNFSVKGSAGELWQSPSGVAKGQLDPRRFIPVCIETLKVLRPMSSKPSDETPLHAAIYRRYAGARVVIHVHPPNLVKASNRCDELSFCGQEMSKILGRKSHEGELVVKIIPNSQDMVGLGQWLDTALFREPILILRGHGVYSWGENCLDALKKIEGLEFLCQTQ